MVKKIAVCTLDLHHQRGYSASATVDFCHDSGAFLSIACWQSTLATDHHQSLLRTVCAGAEPDSEDRHCGRAEGPGDRVRRRPEWQPRHPEVHRVHHTQRANR